ncbi:TPA: hypothetical protein VE770_001515 [Streptococcus pyogenes]|nr:hypothetical protein [Streptococcus pyogenes]HEQ2856587.1 hypothetical protein [Streptococcus pyogenes]HEQ2888025.1 hypothetical protein [Streptococcus pyogenes]HEQ3015299.1 hypothetical protein [Streptococcus pyogenes]HEQ3017067.1 hypothetical protein [Streptococcus pyogenes]
MRYIGESQLSKDLVTKDYVDNKVTNLASKDDIVNLGKIKDSQTGAFLEVKIVPNGQVPYDTTGRIVFERSGGK